MTREWTEEMIAAYVDGSLAPDEAARMREIILKDEAARAYAEEIERSNALIRDAFAAPMTEEMPENIRAVLEGDDSALAEKNNVVAFRPRLRQWAPMALAAALVAAVGIGVALRGGNAPERIALLGDVPADAPLHFALEDLPSGARSDRGIVPMLTFKDKDGRYCREFEVFGELPSELEFGIACRASERGWHVEMIAAAPEATPNAEGMVPASGPSAAALDATLDALGADAPLSPEMERALIEKGWRNG